MSTSSDSGAGDVGWGLAALRPPIVPSLDFALGFSGDGVGDVWASIGGVDVGVGDLVRARPPSVPRRLRGEGADDVGGWGVWLFSREGSCDVDGVGFWEAWDGPSRSSSSSSVSSSWVKGPRVVMAGAVDFVAGGVGDVLALAGAGAPVLLLWASRGVGFDLGGGPSRSSSSSVESWSCIGTSTFPFDVGNVE